MNTQFFHCILRFLRATLQFLRTRDSKKDGVSIKEFGQIGLQEKTVKQFYRRASWALIILSMTCGPASAQDSWMPDPSLQLAVREELGLGTNEPFTRDDLLKLQRLDPYKYGVKSLTGLEHAKNLTWFSFAGNDVSDLSPLAELTQLQLLYGWSNKRLSDISPLAELTQLRVLNLGVCNIQDITVLANLTQLEELTLYYNEISDIRPLENLTELTFLRINSNYITDITPLENLNKLETLWIHHNSITDVSFLQSATFEVRYDEICEIPGLPIRERIAAQSKPSFFLWGKILNRRDLEDTQRTSLADLYMKLFGFDLRFRFVNGHWQLVGLLDEARAQRDALLAENPNLIFLHGISFRTEFPGAHREDWEHWIRDENGDRVHVNSTYYTAYLIDFTHPEVQDMIVAQAIAIRNCGLYDGIFFDWWNENASILDGYRSYSSVLAARITVLRRIRQAIGDDFLILVNPNRSKPIHSAPYINGIYMENGRDTAHGYTPQGLMEIEDTLLWVEENLREPQMNIVEGWGVIVPSDETFATPTADNKSVKWSRVTYTRPDHPENIKWSRLFTAMSLTHSDGYVTFYNGYFDKERTDGANHWYDIYNAELGRSVSETATLYQTPKGITIDGLFIREFDHGWAVYNRSGKERLIKLREKVRGFSSGVENKLWHTIPDLDGEIYLKVGEAINPADLNGDGTVNILDLVIVANGLGSDEPDLNGDGTVNILDLVIIATEM